MILVKVKEIPAQWEKEDQNMIGQEFDAHVKDGYVTLYPNGDNIPSNMVEFVKDHDGEWTKEDFEWTFETSENKGK